MPTLVEHSSEESEENAEDATSKANMTSTVAMKSVSRQRKKTVFIKKPILDDGDEDDDEVSELSGIGNNSMVEERDGGGHERIQIQPRPLPLSYESKKNPAFSPDSRKSSELASSQQSQDSAHSVARKRKKTVFWASTFDDDSDDDDEVSELSGIGTQKLLSDESMKPVAPFRPKELSSSQQSPGSVTRGRKKGVSAKKPIPTFDDDSDDEVCCFIDTR